MQTLDQNGWLPLHHALRNNASLGSIKLLLKGNLCAVRVADNRLSFPLHIVSEFSTVGVVKFVPSAVLAVSMRLMQIRIILYTIRAVEGIVAL